MPGWAKALIIIGVMAVLLVVGAVVAGAFWWSRNKDTLIARGKAVITEAQDAGHKTDNQGCVDQSISRYKAVPGFTSAISTGIFMQTCLDVSRPTSGFCDGVPRETEFMKSGQWRIAQCEKVDLSSDQYCQQLFAPVQRFCEKAKVRSDREQR
jgi:ABC-type lipoprotein release transport system permease subunit